MKRFLIIICVVAAFSSAMIGRTSAADARVEQAPSAVPHRIICLIPAVTEMLFAMGGGADVIGVSTYDHYPPEATTRPRLGALIDPDIERILSLRPDLVVVYGTQMDLIARLDRAHIPMFKYEHAGLADITITIRALGARVGRSSDADRLAGEIEHSLDDIRARVKNRPRPKTLLVFGREPGSLRGIYASAGVGFLHDMLDVAGGDDVFGEVKKQSVQATTEQILAHAPDVIIEFHSDSSTPDRQARDLNVWRTLASVPAVKNNRLYLLPDDMMVIPGPRVADATLVLAKRLHPDAFR